MTISYDFEMERVIREIAERGAERILIQLPEGLRPKALWLTRRLEAETGVRAYISGGTCYGGCDLPLHEAESLGVDLIIHYGHNRMLPDDGIPVIYVEVRGDFDVEELLNEARPLLDVWRDIGLASTVQHVHLLRRAAKTLKRWGFTPHIGRGGGNLHDGQVLGCNYSTALSIADMVDGFLFIGGGRFHPIGIALATGREIVAADPYMGKAIKIGYEEAMKMLRRRIAIVEEVKRARNIGIIVSVKPGQIKVREAEKLRGELEERGYRASIIILDVVRAEILNDFTEFEAFIDTACPRIALDGIPDLRKPMITLQEAYMMMGVMEWGEMLRRSYPKRGWRRL